MEAKIPKFKLIRKIGSGSFGILYKYFQLLKGYVFEAIDENR